MASGLINFFVRKSLYLRKFTECKSVVQCSFSGNSSMEVDASLEQNASQDTQRYNYFNLLSAKKLILTKKDKQINNSAILVQPIN